MHVLPRAGLAAVVAIATVYGLAAAPAQAAPSTTDVVYTDQASFLNHTQSSYYLETFNSLPAYGSVTSPTTFTGSSYSYMAKATNGLFGVTPDSNHSTDHTLATAQADHTITITFTKPVTAVGGNFFETDSNGQAALGSVVITLSDGNTQTLNGTMGVPQPFVGFTSTASIDHLTVDTSNISNFATINNFIVGTAVVAGAPEPSGWAALGFTGLTVGGLLLRARRRKALAAD